MHGSETINGTRKRASAEGVMDSDIPTKSSGTKRREGDLHSAFVAGKEVVQQHAQWRHCAMKARIDTQSREDPSVPSVIDGGGSVLTARVATKRNRVLRQELTEAEGRVHADLVRKA